MIKSLTNPVPPSWPVGVNNLWHKQFNHIKGNISLVLMHSGIVNGYQLLCDAHTVLEPHRGTAALFLFHSLLMSFSTFSFYVYVTITVLFLFLGASIVYSNNI